MDKPKILPLPGNSSKEGNFYEVQVPASPIADDNGNLGFGNLTDPRSVDHNPFKIDGGRNGR